MKVEEEFIRHGTKIEHMGDHVISATYDPAKHGKLKKCPFCGSADLEVNNTHTPSFWVECLNCSAEVHGDYDSANDKPSSFLERCDLYIRALVSAVTCWNRRV